MMRARKCTPEPRFGGCGDFIPCLAGSHADSLPLLEAFPPLYIESFGRRERKRQGTTAKDEIRHLRPMKKPSKSHSTDPPPPRNQIWLSENRRGERYHVRKI